VRLFLDTAEVEEIRHGVRLGVVSGVTTNPTLVAKAGRTSDYKAAVTEICSIVNGPVSAEVLSLETEGMVQEAREIASWSPHVVIKMPCTAAGLEAISLLARENIKTNLTLFFSTNQALLGSLAGATYISPFVGRLDDVGQDGMELVADIVQLLDRYDLASQVIAASIRHPMHCVVAARAGAHIATIPYSVLMQMVNHPLTTIGVERFMEDWRRVSGQGPGERK